MKFINKIATGIFASLLFTGITTVNAMKRWANNTISIKHQSRHKKENLQLKRRMLCNTAQRLICRQNLLNEIPKIIITYVN